MDFFLNWESYHLHLMKILIIFLQTKALLTDLENLKRDHYKHQNKTTITEMTKAKTYFLFVKPVHDLLQLCFTSCINSIVASSCPSPRSKTLLIELSSIGFFLSTSHISLCFKQRSEPLDQDFNSFHSLKN